MSSRRFKHIVSTRNHVTEWEKLTHSVLFAGCRVKPFPGGRYVWDAALQVFGPDRGVDLNRNRNRRRRWLALQAPVVQRSHTVSGRILGGPHVHLQAAQRSAFRVAATKLFCGNRAPSVCNRNVLREYLRPYTMLGKLPLFFFFNLK